MKDLMIDRMNGNTRDAFIQMLQSLEYISKIDIQLLTVIYDNSDGMELHSVHRIVDSESAIKRYRLEFYLTRDHDRTKLVIDKEF